MGIGVSVFLIAVGAILTWAVEFQAQGINLDVVGVILMTVGFLGLLFSMLFWSSFAPFGPERRTMHDTAHGAEVTEATPRHRHIA